MSTHKLLITESPVGSILIIAEEGFIIELDFAQDNYECEHIKKLKEMSGRYEQPVLKQAHEWLYAYFSGNVQEIPPLKLQGTDFRMMVWELIKEIPYGKTRSYGELAKILAKKRGGAMSARAVGGAAGKNPIAIMVPCHRLVGANGKLVGFGGGIEKKKILLEIEREYSAHL
jgi:methylated-DNA-[protein]-cysteine S-methyltransferase